MSSESPVVGSASDAPTGLEEGDRLAGTVAVAPRVTLESMLALVDSETTFTIGAATDALGLPTAPECRIVTLCVLVLRNGWTLVGKSAPASAANFNADLGARFAREDAIRQLWPLEGYTLRCRLSTETPT